MPTQKETVLNMLKAAGNFGVRSDTYLAEYIPRAAARVRELREEGYEITSEKEKQFVRYTLIQGGDARRKADVPTWTPSTRAIAGRTAGKDVNTPGADQRSSVASDMPLFEETSYERLQDAA